MVYIAKSMNEYLMKRKKNIQNLNEEAKHLELLKKMVAHQKQSGTPLFEGYKQADSLESALDISKVDENLEKKLIAMGGRPQVAKAWIQSLEPTIKRYVSDRFPAFQRSFEKNFGVVNVVNLKANFRLFNFQQLEAQKKIQVPSIQAILRIIEDANPKVRERFAFELIKSSIQMERWFNSIPVNMRSSGSDLIKQFISQYENDVEAFSAIAYIGNKVGLVFPVPSMNAGEDDDILKPIGKTNGDLSSITESQGEMYDEFDFDTDEEEMYDRDDLIDDTLIDAVNENSGLINPSSSAEIQSTAQIFKVPELNEFLSIMYNGSIPTEIKRMKKVEKIKLLAENQFNFATETFIE